MKTKISMLTVKTEMKEYTEGPWCKTRNMEPFNSQGIAIHPEDGSGAIAIVLGGNSDECKANARLIAAAPELLEKLLEIRKMLSLAVPLVAADINELLQEKGL